MYVYELRAVEPSIEGSRCCPAISGKKFCPTTYLGRLDT